MSIQRTVFKGASWLAFFKFFSQGISWVVTIIVARLLVPGDYGLSAMATVITSYAEMFSEMGLGSAIIQRSSTDKRQLSSVFWFSLMLSSVFALACFPVANITAKLFNEPRVIPLTRAVGVIFLLSGMEIVPLNILKRNISFRKIGIIEMSSTIVTGGVMVLLARMGAGVWTLIGGRITRAFVKVVITYSYTRWFPGFHFNFREVLPFIRFGSVVAIGRTFYYIWEKSDKFFAGKAWNSRLLGYYSFALQLAQIPTEKIVNLINQVSFPAFSKLQNDREEFKRFYLNITKATAAMVLPLFICGFVIGDDLVKLMLNEKWYPIIKLFRYLCLAQIMLSLNAINNFVHVSQGRPQWGLYYNIAGASLMPLSFYFAVQHGLEAIIVPWVSTFIVLCVVWIRITLRKIEIGFSRYLNNLFHPMAASLLLLISLSLFNNGIGRIDFFNTHLIVKVLTSLVAGGSVYLGYLWFFDRAFLRNFKMLIRR
jgi:O-antigen/teichoic acid export membrane protein